MSDVGDERRVSLFPPLLRIVGSHLVTFLSSHSHPSSSQLLPVTPRSLRSYRSHLTSVPSARTGTMNGAKSDRRDEEEVRCKDGGSYLPVTALYGRDSLSVTPHPPSYPTPSVHSLRSLRLRLRSLRSLTYGERIRSEDVRRERETKDGGETTERPSE